MTRLLKNINNFPNSACELFDTEMCLSRTVFWYLSPICYVPAALGAEVIHPLRRSMKLFILRTGVMIGLGTEANGVLETEIRIWQSSRPLQSGDVPYSAQYAAKNGWDTG